MTLSNFFDHISQKTSIPSKVGSQEIVLKGVALSFGMVAGQAYFYKISQAVKKTTFEELNIRKEKEKIKKSISKLRNNISEMLSETAIVLTEESLEIFDVYRLLVQDAMFEKELIEIIESGKTAYEATELIAQKFRQKMRHDSFWQTRLYDMQYLLRQLRHFLQEESDSVSWKNEECNLEKNPIILIAPYISPADLLYYYRYRRVVGLILKDSSQTSHAAIVARSLHIPTLGGIYLTPQKALPFSQLLVDANSERLYIQPSSKTLEQLQRKAIIFHGKNDELPLQTVTKDNVKIDLHLNANLETDFELLQHPIINGVGLFRTEILFMIPDIATDFYAQAEEYKKIFDQAGDKPVIFRTIDMTDDKEAEVFNEDVMIKRLPDAQKAPLKEPINFSKHLVLATPMGKVLLNRHQFLRTQIRALLRARTQSKNPYGSIYIMIPMISDVVELKAYQKIIETEAMHEAKKNSSIISQIKIGVMIEVPSLVYQINRFHSLVDFVSIGTNDLFQFFFATNRWDTQSRRSQDVLEPAFLQFIGNIVHQFMQLGIPIHVCGEMAANPLTAMALLGLGVRKLSVAPSTVGHIAKMVNSLSLGLLYPYMRLFRVEPYEFCIATSMQYESSVDVRHTLQRFAYEHGILV